MCGEAPKTVLSAQLYFAKPICGGRGSAANDSDTHSLNRCSNQRRKNNLNMDYESDDLSFVVAFPLPFRVLFLAGVGILGWAANLHGLRLLGVDAASALDLRTIERTPLPLVVDGPHHAHTAVMRPSSIFSSIFQLCAPLLSSYLCFPRTTSCTNANATPSSCTFFNPPSGLPFFLTCDPPSFSIVGVLDDAYRHPQITECISQTWFLLTYSPRTRKY